jgi:outer membrane immunogenic protein
MVWYGARRLGYAFGRFLPYVTGGVAFGDIETIAPPLKGTDNTKFGWTIGAGVEAAFAKNWTAKLEFLHVDLGSASCGFSCGTSVPGSVTFQDNILRFGINFAVEDTTGGTGPRRQKQ